MFNAGVRGKRAKDGVGFLSTAEQFNQKSFLVPTVTSFSVTDVSYVPLDNTAVDIAGGETIVINGSGFASGATVQVGATTIGSVTFIDQNRLTFTAPALSSGSYTIYVTNSNGGTGILLSGLVYSGLPTFTTTAGTLGTVYETANINTAVVATGDAPITYSVISGTLPAGANINSNGTITGNAPVDGSSTTYSFTIQASDGQLQDSTRAFTLTINTDVLTWGLANNTVYSLDGGTVMSNVTLSATSSANSNSAVTFAANTLPTGVSLSGNTIFGTPTTEQTVYSTLTATATQTGRTATRFVSWVVSVSDLFFKYNTLAIQGADTTFVDDASTNNFAVTIAGDTKPNSLNPYTPGYYSNYFDGTGDYLSLASNAAFTVGTGDVTIETWIYCTSLTQTYQGIIGGRLQDGNTGYPGLSLVIDNSKLFFTIMGISTGLTDPDNVPLNRWVHVVGVRSGTNAALFVNGVRKAFSASNSTNGSSSNMAIGRYYSAGDDNYYFSGYISNARLVKGTAVYDPTVATLTVPTTPLTAIANTSLLTCQSNRFIDTSTNNFTLTANGNTTINSFDPFVPNSSYSTYGSGYFDGTGDYLSVDDNSAFALSNSNFTMEAWIYPTATGDYPTIAAQYGSGINSSFFWSLGPTANPRDVYFIAYLNGNTVTAQASNVVVLNTWSHHAVVRNSGTLTYYINGVSVATASIGSSSLVDSTRLFTIGNSGESVYTSYPFTGYITNVRVVNGTAVYTTTFTPPSAPLTAIANTSLLTLQNNQPVNNSVFLDGSTNNFNITRNGNPTQGTFSPYGSNWSNYFGGTDYLSLANNANLNPSTQDFVMEAWVFLTGTTGNNQGINGKGTAGTDGYTFYVTNALVLSFIWNGTGGATITGGTLVLNTWNHVAVVRNSNVIRLYLNGVGAGSSTACTTDITSTATKFVGQARGANPILGYMSNYRMTKGSLPSGYDATSASLTPPTAPLTAISGTSLLTCQSNRFIDNSTNNFTITRNGDVSVQRFSPFNPSADYNSSTIGGSGYFDGSGDYLSTPADNAFAFGTGDFTIEFWAYKTANTPGDYDLPFSTGVDGTGANGYFVELSATRGFLFCSGNNIILTYAMNPNTSSWNHYAVTRSGSTLRFFVDGAVVASTTNSTSLTSTVLVRIGGIGNHYFGYLSDLRVVKGTAVYTTTYTVPTAPLPAISGTSLLCKFTNAGIIDNTMLNNLETVGNTQISTTQSKFGGSSMYFDGTGDYLTQPSSQNFNFGTGNFTMEGWFYQTGLSSSYPGIVSNPLSWGNAGAWSVLSSHVTAGIRKLQFYCYNAHTSNPLLLGTTTLSDNTWYYFAVTRSDTTFRLFLDGTIEATATFGGNVNSTSSGLVVGINQTASGYTFQGYIDDLRITKGYARYTANFTAPIATFKTK